MKSKLLLCIIGCFPFVNSQAQTGNISASIGTGYFIEGVRPTWNTISVTNVPSGTDTVRFGVFDLSYTYSIGGYVDANGSNGWAFDFDMGSIPSRTLDSLGLGSGVVIYAVYYDVNGNPINYSPDLFINMLPKPAWLNSGTVSNINISGGNISMDASFPIDKLASNYLPNDVLGLEGKAFQVYGDSIKFHIVFNMAIRNSTVSNINLYAAMNIFNQDSRLWQIPVGNSGLTLDNNFELAANFSKSYSTPKLELNYHSTIPISPLVSINYGGGLSVYGTIKGQVVLGQYLGDWGFVKSGNDVTSIVAKAEGSGFLRAGMSAGYGAASANGILEITGKIGGGIQYANLPSVFVDTLLGYDFTVSGKVLIETLWGFGPNATIGPTDFFHKDFGDYNALKQSSNSYDALFGSSAKTFKANGTLTLPDNAPQPSFATRGNNLYAVWVEKDEQNQTTYLLFSKLNQTGDSFSPELVVESNQHSISNPKVGILPSGRAIITWTQSRYTSSTLPGNAELKDFVAAQDIWFAIYDNTTDGISYKSMIDDDNSGLQSGRAEGEATISMLSNAQGIITWIAADLLSNSSQVMYSIVSEDAVNWNITSPLVIGTLPGKSKEVNVVDLDTIFEALAVWINDPDGDESTYNSHIRFSLWDGNSWDAITQLDSLTVPASFDELSLSSSQDYVGMAFTTTFIYPNDSVVKNYEVRVLDKKGLPISNQDFWDYSNTNYFQKPRVAISSDGIILSSYQAIPMFPDSDHVDLGVLHLYAKNLNNTTGQWQEITNAITAYDSNTFIWKLTTGFGKGNDFYTLTQEYNEQTGIVTNPNNGVLFGDPSLSMVLRGLHIDNNLTVTDIAEPTVPTGIKKILSDFPYVNLMQNYPNPLSDYTVIEYRILEPAFVDLSIFDLTGRKITTLVNEKIEPGMYQTVFRPGKIQSGTYLYKLRVNGREITKKMVISN